MDTGLDASGIEQVAGKRRINLRRLLLWAAPLLFLALFYFYPLGSILQISFTFGQGGALAAFLQALSSSTLRNV